MGIWIAVQRPVSPSPDPL